MEIVKQFREKLTNKTQLQYHNARYTGDNYNGIKEGKGMLEMANGSVYMGYFKNDLPNGLGIILFNNN